MPSSAKSITITLFIIVAFGFIMLSSSSIIQSQRIFGKSYYYLTHQILYGLLPGLIAFFIFSKIPYTFWRKFALPFLLIAVGLTVLVFAPGIGYTFRGARRWLNTGFFIFQPSEILKLSIILYLAAWFSKYIAKSKNGIGAAAVPFLIVTGFILLLLANQPDIGTLGVIIAIALTMYFVAGARIKHLLSIAMLGVGAFGVLFLVAPYRINRLLVFLNPNTDPRGIGYHLKQSFIAIGSGGWWGRGFGQSIQKIGFLPEPMGDSIFAVIVEELGFFGAIALIGLFALLFILMIRVALRSPDNFARLVVVGVMSWVAIQFIVNTAAISGLLPLTGITLPFISYGGTSLVVLLATMGIVVNVAKNLDA